PLQICLTISSHSSADHTTLHTFPTRRSSDLNSDGVTTSVRESRNNVAGRKNIEAELIGKNQKVSSLDEMQEHIAFKGARSWEGLDRKSTRLNSSHQIISYAVFCLKKKTKNKD